MILEKLLSSFAVCFVLLVWFETNAIVEYLRLWGFKKYFKIEEFGNSTLSSYPTYLIVTYPNFFTKLLNCPICVGFWLNIGCSVFVPNFDLFFINFYLSLVLYYVFNLIKKS